MTFPQISEDIRNCEYKSVALVDKNGRELIPYNSKSVALDKRLTEIQKRLNSIALTPGVYQVHARHWENNTAPVVYYIAVGNQAEAIKDITLEEAIVPAKVKPKNLPALSDGHNVSWEKYQELLQENLELQTTNARLELEINQLRNEIDELEEELEEAEEGGSKGDFLSDGTKDWINKTIETVTPLADKWLEQRDKQLQIQANQVYLESLKMSGQKPVIQQPVQQPGVSQPGSETEEEDELTEEEELILDNFAYLKDIDPELYNKVVSRIEVAKQNGEA